MNNYTNTRCIGVVVQGLSGPAARPAALTGGDGIRTTATRAEQWSVD